MSETRYSDQIQTPIASEVGGAIVPAGSSSIAQYAKGVYLSLPKERQGRESWGELRTLAEQGDWGTLQEIHHHFSVSYSQVDNSSHDHRSYSDSRQVAYTDERSWNDHQIAYTDNTALSYHDQSAITYDDRSWVDYRDESSITYDDRRWEETQLSYVDNSSYAYAPVNYFVDNSMYVVIDDSFNGNGNSSSSNSKSGGGSGLGDEPFIYRLIAFMFSFALLSILTVGFWNNVRSNGTPSNPNYYTPVQ